MVTGWLSVPMSVPAPLRIHTEGARRRSPHQRREAVRLHQRGRRMQQGCGLAGMRGQHVTGPQGRQRLGMHGERVQRVRVHHGGRARGAHQQGLHECRRFRFAPDARPQRHRPALAQKRQKLLKQCRAPPHVPRRAEGTGHDVRAVRLDVPAQAVRSGDADQPASGTQGGPGGQMRRARKPFRTAHDQNGPGGPLCATPERLPEKLRQWLS